MTTDYCARHTGGAIAYGIFNESSLRTQGPIQRGLSFLHWSRGLFSLLGPGVMGPCVRRDDPLRACARPLPHQRAAQFSHMRFPSLARGEADENPSAVEDAATRHRQYYFFPSPQSAARFSANEAR